VEVELERLAAQSLVQIDQPVDGEPRVRLLETIGAYALEQLIEAGEDAVARQRWADYYVRLAEQAAPHLTGGAQAEWLARLEQEYDNLRAVLAWADADGAALVGLRLAGLLWRFWHLHGYLSEGRAWCERFLARDISIDGGEALSWRARALAGTAGLAYRQGDHARATAQAAESLALCRRLEDGAGGAIALRVLALVARDQGDLPRAIRMQEDLLVLCRAMGDRYGVGAALHNLGLLWRDRGDYDRSLTLYEESLAIKQARGDTAGMAMTLQSLADVAWATGDLTRAETLSGESLDLARRIGDKSALAYALNGLGTVALSRGDAARARDCYAQSLALRREIDDIGGAAGALINLGHVARRQGDLSQAASHYRSALELQASTGMDLVECLQGLAEVLVRQGEPERAAHLLGVSAGLQAAPGGAVPAPEVRADDERITALVRAQARRVSVDFDAAWAAGRALPLEQAVAAALAVAGGS
jgi:tetratricopeptide (TPR) repeat protein